MSAYTDHFGFAEPVGGIEYRLLADLDWRIGHEGGPLYRVPAGFVFDVSFPRWTRWLLDPHRHEYHKASAIHDHMLKAGWSRITSGAEFHNALKADGVPRLARAVFFLAVVFRKYD